MSGKWDYESQLDTTTRADSGAYDQITALSQGLINENFKKLYEVYADELCKLNYKGPLGKFNGKVQPPVILIPGADKPSANLNEVIVKVSFDSGKMAGSDDKNIIEDLKGWVFAVRTPVVPEDLPDPSTISDPKKKKAVEEKRKRIAERFDHPGDYTIDRLYMKLSTARWDNLDLEHSVAGLDENGRPIPYADWAADEDNRDASDLLTFWLKKWSADNERDSLNSLGLTFKPPVAPQSKPTYVPKNVLHQVHQYKSERNGYKNGKTGLGGAGDCNCLMYLEMVDGGGEKPRDPRVIWSGDFATLESSGHPAIRGTFLLNSEIFIQKFLLPNFTPLNRLSELYHSTPTFEVSGRTCNVHLRWSVGGDPNYHNWDDPVYQFKPVPDPDNNRLVVGYKWIKSTKWGPLDGGSNDTKQWYRAWTNDEARTQVTWEAGKNEVVLSGTSTSSENCQSASKKSSLDNPTSWLYDTYTVTWRVKCKILAGEDENGSYLRLEVDGPEGGASYVNVDSKVNHYNWDSAGHEKVIKNNLETSMRSGIDQMIADIRDKLKTTGRLTYPGGAALSFENPATGRYGDLNVRVKYRPFKNDGRIKVPNVKGNSNLQATPRLHTLSRWSAEALPASGLDAPTSFLDIWRPLISHHKLIWTPRLDQAGQTGQTTLTLRGMNGTEEKVDLAACVFRFRVGNHKGCVFAADSTFDYYRTTASSASTGLPTSSGDNEEGGENEKEGENKVNSVILSWSDDMYVSTASLNQTAEKDGTVLWEIEVRSGGFWGEAMHFPPGAWVEVSITGVTATAGGHRVVMVNEKTQDDKGTVIAEWEKDLQLPSSV